MKRQTFNWIIFIVNLLGIGILIDVWRALDLFAALAITCWYFVFELTYLRDAIEIEE